MRAFHGDSAIKEMYLARVRAHAAADEIVKGRYWENGKGCAIGCVIHGSDHATYAEEVFGDRSAEWLARLIDGMFEALPNGKAKTFPMRVFLATEPGADVSGVRDQFLAWLMDDPTYGLVVTASESLFRALAAEVGRRLRTGEGVTGPAADELTERLRAARDACAARAARAACAAWDARAARDAWAAMYAWAAGAAGAAWDAFVVASSEELLRLLAAVRPA